MSLDTTLGAALVRHRITIGREDDEVVASAPDAYGEQHEACSDTAEDAVVALLVDLFDISVFKTGAGDWHASGEYESEYDDERYGGVQIGGVVNASVTRATEWEAVVTLAAFLLAEGREP